jgi:hypothetical protein
MIRMIARDPDRPGVLVPTLCCDWCGEVIEDDSRCFDWMISGPRPMAVNSKGEHSKIYIAYTHRDCWWPFEDANHGLNLEYTGRRRDIPPRPRQGPRVVQ